MLVMANIALFPDLRLPIETVPDPPPLKGELVRNLRDWHYGDFSNGSPTLYGLGRHRIGLYDRYPDRVDFAILSMFHLIPELRLSFEDASFLFHYGNRSLIGVGILSQGQIYVYEGGSANSIPYNGSVVASAGYLTNNTRGAAILDKAGVLWFMAFTDLQSLRLIRIPLNRTFDNQVVGSSLELVSGEGWRFTIFMRLGDSFTRYRFFIDFETNVFLGMERYAYWSEFQFGSMFDGVFLARSGLVEGVSVLEDSFTTGFRYRVVTNSSSISFVSSKPLELVLINDTLVFYSFDSNVRIDDVPLDVWMVLVPLNSLSVLLLPRDVHFSYIFSRMGGRLLGSLAVADNGAAFLFAGVDSGMELYVVLGLTARSVVSYAEEAEELSKIDPLAFLENLGYLYWLILPVFGWLMDLVLGRRRVRPKLYPLLIQEELRKRNL